MDTNSSGATSELNTSKHHRDVIVYVDQRAVAPAPSRDYYRLFVSDSMVSLTHWPICHKNTSPSDEKKIALGLYETDHDLVVGVAEIFGEKMHESILDLSHGGNGDLIFPGREMKLGAAGEDGGGDIGGGAVKKIPTTGGGDAGN